MLETLPVPPPGKSGWPWDAESRPACYAHREAWPRISIVTPSFNQGAFIEETIRSVLLQNYPNLQYLVIDGGSTDGTVKILEKYSPWIDYWVSEPDRGQSDAINKGLAHCDGEWFNWLNSDDYLLLGSLAAIAGAAQTLPDARLIAGQLQVISADGAWHTSYTVKVTGRLADDIVNHQTAQPAMFYRHDAFSPVDESLHYAMDFDLWVRLLSTRGTTDVHLLGEPVAAFRRHTESKTCSQQSKFELEERIILRRLAAALGSSPSFLNALAPAAIDRTVAFGTASGKIERRDLERELVRRYLLGDTTRVIQQLGFISGHCLFWICARVLPATTALAACKAFAKRWLHRLSHA